jgi:hypothetical protein
MARMAEDDVILECKGGSKESPKRDAFRVKLENEMSLGSIS